MAKGPYRRPAYETVLGRVRERRRFIQVLAGPRQAGKTTLARQVIGGAKLPSHYASADDPATRDRSWLEAQWDLARLRAHDAGRDGALLVLDEAQKIPEWAEVVKRHWDEDTAAGLPLKLMVLGSAPLLSESLAGRFELVRVGHWSFGEMRDAFGWPLDRYLYYGGYPGAASLVAERDRWARYILDSLVETTLSRDILLLSRIAKPALLRQLFRLACDYSGQILSYQKMLGQLQDAGNTTTLAHYLELLAGAGMVTGLQKLSGARVRQRGSSPKLLALNTALMTSAWDVPLERAREDAALWGRLVETAAGAHLVNESAASEIEVLYWRSRGHEVDFVLRRGRSAVGIEVTSGRRRDSLPGMDALARTQRLKRRLLVGGGGIPLEEFLLTPPEAWLR